MFRYIAATFVASCLFVSSANAMPILNGDFNVTAVNATGLNAAESQATLANFEFFRNNGGTSDTFSYSGSLNFGTFDGTDATTISGFLDSGSGMVAGLDAGFGGQTLSTPNVFANPGTATTTFFLFELVDSIGVGDFTVIHDDGFALFEDGVRLGGVLGPISETTTPVANFGGGALSILYVATNGDPSILNVSFEATEVPEPPTMFLLASGLGLLSFLRWRRRHS